MSDDPVRLTSFPRDAPGSPAAMMLPFLRLLAISGVSLSVIGGGGQREVIASSDETVARIEELQFELGEGPGYDVAATGIAQQLRPGAASAAGAPFFDAAVAGLGVSTIITLPLRSGAIVVGVVTLYRQDAGPLSDADMATAAALVHWVAGPVIERAIVSAGQDSPAGESTKSRFRREVHQATGMIVIQLDTTASDAFLRLKAHAFVQGMTVEAVARDVIDRRLDFAHLPQ